MYAIIWTYAHDLSSDSLRVVTDTLRYDSALAAHIAALETLATLTWWRANKTIHYKVVPLKA